MAGQSRKPTRSQRAAELAERRAEMYRLHVVERLDQAEIGRRYGVSQQAVSEQIRKAIADRSAHANDETKAIELAKLDAREREVVGVMRRTHYLVSRGKIVERWDEELGRDVPLLDDAPILQSVDRLVAIARLRADLLGLKSPARVSVEAAELGDKIKGLVASLFADDDDADDRP